jgi:hypothetical protein
MPTTQFDRILDNTKLHLPGALEEVVKVELFNVLDEFFKESTVWREDIDFTLEAGVTEYAISADSSNSARIHSLIKVVDEFDRPYRMTMDEPGVLNLITEVSSDTDVVATVIITTGEPLDSDDFPLVPDWITEKYFQVLIDGLLSRLMASPGKPYFNERLSVLHMRKFSSGKALAKGFANRSNLFGAQRWRYPKFA